MIMLISGLCFVGASTFMLSQGAELLNAWWGNNDTQYGAFIAPLKNPVQHQWTMRWGLIICFTTLIAVFIFGWMRSILYWFSTHLDSRTVQSYQRNRLKREQ